MTRRERLMATLRGEPVDRPAVSLYEIGGFTVDPDDPDPFNIYNSPSWRPLLQLAEERTDLIRLVSPGRQPAPGNARDEFYVVEQTEEETGHGRSRFRRVTVQALGRTLRSVDRRDAGLDTWWTVEHLLKDADDARAFLEIPESVHAFEADISPLECAEAAVGDRGIVMVDIGTPLADAAALFSMEDYTVLAFTEPALFHALVERFARATLALVEDVSRRFPGRLWRLYGPEYASEPYLPSRLFREFAVRYDEPLVRAIQRHGGYARIHSHGRLRNILGYIAGMRADGLDPIEPPPQGDVSLAEVRREVGREMVLFGNLEASDIENMQPAEFERVVVRALREGTEGEGRGFVLLPSASPYGRDITPRTMANYETIVRLAESWAG